MDPANPGHPAPGAPPVKTTPDPYSGPTHIDPGHGTVDPNSGKFQPPSVPSGSGSGSKTQVDTQPMEVFASNMEQLVDPVQRALDRLHGIDVHAGAFYDGNVIRKDLNGANGDDGLKKKLGDVLHDLTEGLTDIAKGVRDIAGQYSKVHDASVVDVSDLTKAMQPAQSDFDALAKDNGATPATGSTSTGSSGSGSDSPDSSKGS
ncbi:hypothetical protein [Streptomyces sp. GbtcB6]|uniref:hypothetical protein n=1 Tax=Streptomyces sp. GbtcB6 TaxID=2824751 RepID=UPI001C2FEF45|nr:hypothetical protein [Streptomyces sp. GbtcB6]